MLNGIGTRLGLAVAAGVVLAACTTASTGGPSVTPKDLLLERAPTGFHQGLDTGLPLRNAASVLATDASRTGAQLSSFGYSDGAERVWTKGDEYTSALVFEFNSAVGPGNFVAFVRTELRPRSAVTLFDDGTIPGGQGFDLFGLSRTSNRQVFCQGAFFPVDRYMFQVEDCASGPRYAAGPLALARAQYERAARLLGLPVVPPSPPPG